jgi:hypothetical protein
VVDAVAPGKQRGDHCQRLGSRVGRTGHGAKLEVLINQLPQPQLLAERGRQQQPRVGHQTGIVEGHAQGVESVGSFHLTGASCAATLERDNPIVSAGIRHLFFFQQVTASVDPGLGVRLRE